MGNLKREEKKDEALADQLHVLNEEFAQAIIFKRNELLERENSKSKEDKPNDIYDQATKEIMQEYFNNDQLNMLPKPIMKTSLLTQMKNNRELPLYGFKQSMNIVQPTISHKTVGDGNKAKSLDDLLAFKSRLEQCYDSNSLAVINGRIRFDHEKLYVQLRKLSARMSQY